jgi:hypothetical protein
MNFFQNLRVSVSLWLTARVTCTLLFLPAVFIGNYLHAQVTPGGEKLVPLTVNPVQAAEARRHADQRTMVFPQDTITLPSAGFIDDFSYNSHQPDTALWDLSNSLDVYVNRTWALSPNDLGVCTFDGLDGFGDPYDTLAGNSSTGLCDHLTSKNFNLTTHTVADSVYLSFFYEPKGRGYAPNTQDSLILQINIPAWNSGFNVNWKTVWFKEGYTPSSADSVFHCAMFKLDSASYFTNGFRFRFLNYATRSGSNDHWHIDDVYMKTQRTFDDTTWRHVDFVYPASSGLKDYWAVPIMHYKPTTMMASNFNVQIVNHDTTSFGRSTTYWYDILDETGAPLTGSYYPGPGGVTLTVPPYTVSGYMNSPTMSNPPIAWSYPQGASLTDSTTYRIRQILHSSTDVDTMIQLQKFYNYYAYDDGTAEVGYGLMGTLSSLAYKFQIPVGVNDNLLAVQFYFLPVHGVPDLRLRDFELTVWNDNNGQPGAVIYRQRGEHPGYSFETPDRFITYTIDSGTVSLTSGQTYYIGWVQQASDIMYLGFDYNTDHHSEIYYNTTGTWYTSVFNGSLMMRPVFGEIYPIGQDETGIAENTSQNNFSLYPNPASGAVNIFGLKEGARYSAKVFDVSGREVIAQQPVLDNSVIDVLQVSAGMYFVQVLNENGEVIGTQRLMIAQ